MQKLVCDGACKSSGNFSLNMVVRCKSTAVRFQAGHTRMHTLTVCTYAQAHAGEVRV